MRRGLTKLRLSHRASAKKSSVPNGSTHLASLEAIAAQSPTLAAPFALLRQLGPPLHASFHPHAQSARTVQLARATDRHPATSSSKNAKPSSKSARRLHHRPPSHHLRRSSTKTARLSSRSAPRRISALRPTAAHSSSKNANTAPTVTFRARSLDLKLSVAPSVWSARRKREEAWRSGSARDLRKTSSWWSIGSIGRGIGKSWRLWRGRRVRRGLRSEWRRIGKVGWLWFGLTIDAHLCVGGCVCWTGIVVF